MLNDELKAKFLDLVTKCDEGYLEYCETHGDYADAYVHCAVGREVDMKAVKRKAVEYMVETLSIDEKMAKRIAERIDEWAIEMEKGDRFTWKMDGRHIVNSFAIEKVENQHDVSVLAKELDIDSDIVRELVRWAKNEDNTNYIGSLHGDDFSTFETYQCTDSRWFATIPDSWFQSQLEELNEERADNDE